MYAGGALLLFRKFVGCLNGVVSVLTSGSSSPHLSPGWGHIPSYFMLVMENFMYSVEKSADLMAK